MKKMIRYYCTATLAAILCLMTLTVTALATASDGGPAIVREASSITGRVTELTADADAYADRNTSSQKKASFKKGDSVLLVSKSDSWYQIFYRGELLYIPLSSISDAAVKEAEEKGKKEATAMSSELNEQAKEMASDAQLLDGKAEDEALVKTEGKTQVMTEEEVVELNKELEEQKKESELMAESLERQERIKRNALIWKIVIGVLVVAIIIVSVVIALKNKKADEANEEDKKDR